MEKELVALALDIATQAHAGQFDKSGVPYVEHVKTVAEGVRDQGPEVEAAALLHDTLEDTSITAAYLRDRGFPEQVVGWIEALTRKPQEGYLEDYVPRIIEAGPEAILIKLSDLAHNMAPGRADLKPSHLQRYLRAQAMLLGAARAHRLSV